VNAVKIKVAISELAQQSFDKDEFLRAFGMLAHRPLPDSCNRPPNLIVRIRSF
jgi:hypothetical protein